MGEPVALRLDEDLRRLRVVRDDDTLYVIDRVGHLIAVELLRKRHVHVHEHVMRAHVVREDAAALDDARVALDERLEIAQFRCLEPLADEQPLGLAQQDDRHAREQKPDEHRGRTVKVGVVEQVAQEDAQKREQQAELCRGILEHDREQARVLCLADELRRPHVAACLVEVAHGDEQRGSLDRGGGEQHHVVHGGVAEHRVRPDFADMGDALVDGDAPAQREDHDGHDERPEVEFLPVAKGVLHVGLARRLLDAEQDEQAVAGIHDGVYTLGDHRRRPRDGGCDELDDADENVRGNRGDHGAGALDSTLLLLGPKPLTIGQRGI